MAAVLRRLMDGEVSNDRRKDMALCAKCGSKVFSDGVEIVERGHADVEKPLSARAFRNPKALLFKGKISIPLGAVICGSCGYVELYVSDPRSLFSALQEAHQGKRRKN